MSKNDTNLVLDVMQSPSAKILLSIGLSINSDAEIFVLNFYSLLSVLRIMSISMLWHELLLRLHT